MQTITEESAIIQKTKELCQAILEQPEYQAIQERIQAFLADGPTKEQFQSLNEKGEYLHHKQQQGIALTPEEIGNFESEREKLLSNPIARDFLDAQQEMQQMQESVGNFVSKTLETGRVPELSELQGGSCGSGCGCH